MPAAPSAASVYLHRARTSFHLGLPLLLATMSCHAAPPPQTAFTQLEWVQTAMFEDGSTNLLKEMAPVAMHPLSDIAADAHTLEVDATSTYQEIVGFGGAFTEAAAINWRSLSDADQAEVIRLYFSRPEDGGHGYTLGRVPMNSNDFSTGSYSFDDVPGDTQLEFFDDSVTHDVDVGIIPMIRAAQTAVRAGGASLNVFASPWSPPAWMKWPAGAWDQQSMLLSRSPNGLMPSMQAAWARYFSRFLAAYKRHGISMWGITVQNEPEAHVAWEACMWTPSSMATFVRDHLGPVLEVDHPGVKIIGFDHNKDHVHIWAKELYADPEAAKYFYGVGVHWYGGLNAKNLNYTHYLNPSKAILATEACNCGGVVLRETLPSKWWARAESLALDILEDLRFWAVGWTDWNLVLDAQGGPNHLRNFCDANIIADPERRVGKDTFVRQASYYFMGHFSRFLPPGARRMAMRNSVEVEAPPLKPGDVKDGQALLFAPCDGNAAQKWESDGTGVLRVRGTAQAATRAEGRLHEGECVDHDMNEGKLQVWECMRSSNQLWAIRAVPGGAQIYSIGSSRCVTAVRTQGIAVGLDAGFTVIAARLKDCAPDGAPDQTFDIEDALGFPDQFPLRTLPTAPGGGGLCLQPQVVRVPHFDAVSFLLPDGSRTLVAMNVGDKEVEVSLLDTQANVGVHALKIPSHAIHTYRWSAQPGAPRLISTSRAASGHGSNSSSRTHATESVGKSSIAPSSHLISSQTPRGATGKVGASIDVRRPRSTAWPVGGGEATSSVAREGTRSPYWFVFFEWRLSFSDVWSESVRAEMADASSFARTRLPPAFVLLALAAAIAGFSLRTRSLDDGTAYVCIRAKGRIAPLQDSRARCGSASGRASPHTKRKRGGVTLI